MFEAMPTSNQNAEQRARDQIDAKLAEAGWIVQHRMPINFDAGPGIAVREYQTDVGPADYILFLDK
jgi:type I restriction enzyme R subunit